MKHSRETRRHLAAAARRIESSLTVRCLAVVAIYAALIALAAIGVGKLSDAYLTSLFPRSIADVLEDREAIANGDYSSLTSRSYDGCEILVLDSDGTPLYASSTAFAQAIRPGDLELINDYDGTGHYYVVEDRVTEGVAYRIQYLVPDEETGFDTVASYALLDGDLNIVEGTLFPDRTFLTPREFKLLLGIFDKNRNEDADDLSPLVPYGGEDGEQDYRLSYVLKEDQYVIDSAYCSSDDGEARIIVFASPTVNESDYDAAAEKARDLQLVLIPIVAVATIILLVIEFRLIRTSLKPLSHAIEGYGESGKIEIERRRVVTELLPVLDGFTELIGRLESAQAEKQRIIADVSHDIKTPLTVIRGYAQAFRDGLVPPEKERAYAEALCEKASDAADMVSALADYAAMEHPEYRCERATCDLAREVAEICKGLGHIAVQHGCSLEVKTGDDALPVRVDGALITRALTNLVANSCIHNGEGTHILAGCERRGDVARIVIADDGRGIPQDIAERAFDLFVTSNVARSSGKGTGLGLAIVKRCIELNGGSIALDPSPAAPWSTMFVIELPLEE